MYVTISIPFVIFGVEIVLVGQIDRSVKCVSLLGQLVGSVGYTNVVP